MILNQNEPVIESGFITPDNVKLEVKFESMGDFCKEQCEIYKSKSKENEENFNKFSDRYYLFNPHYDFLVHFLKWVNVGFLNRNEFAFSYRNRLLTKNMDDFSYERSYEGIVEPHNLIKNIIKKETLYDLDSRVGVIDVPGFIFRDGTYMFLYNLEFHEEISRVLTNLLSLTYPKVCEDYLQSQKTISVFKDYLTRNLGICCVTYKMGILTAVYNKYLITLAQSKIISNTLEVNKDFTEQHMIDSGDVIYLRSLVKHIKH